MITKEPILGLAPLYHIVPLNDKNDDDDHVSVPSQSNDDNWSTLSDEVLDTRTMEDEIQEYNRVFQQQQSICRARDQEEELENAKKRRKQIAEAILGGIHVAAVAAAADCSTKDREEPSIYSVLRNPDGIVLSKIPLTGITSKRGNDDDKERESQKSQEENEEDSTSAKSLTEGRPRLDSRAGRQEFVSS